MDRYVNRNASKTAYNNTVKAFEARFDGFEPSNSVKNDDGSEYIIFKNSSGQRVTIDYNAKSGDISLVCSEDTNIKVFATEFSLKQTEGYESERDGRKFRVSFFKHILIPLAVMSVVIWFVHAVNEAIDSNYRAHFPSTPEEPYATTAETTHTEQNETAEMQTEQGEVTDPYVRPDLHNYADMDEFYKGGVPTDETGAYIYSHNVFRPRDGEEWTIDLSADNYDENGFSGTSYADIRYSGEDEGYQGEWGYLGVTDNDGHASGNDLATIKEPFLLEAEDYDRDGMPDCCVRVSDNMKYITYYTIIQKNDRVFRGFKGYDLYSLSERAYDLSDNDGDPSVWTPHSFKYDNTFCVWGRGEPSITFDRIDDDHFFFITVNEKKQPETVIFDSDYNYVSPEKMRYEMGYSYYIPSVSYRDGKIHVKDTKLDYEYYSGYYYGNNSKVWFRRKPVLHYLDGDILKKVDYINMPEYIEFTQENVMVSSADIPASQLKKGRYRLRLYDDFGSFRELDCTLWFDVD